MLPLDAHNLKLNGVLGRQAYSSSIPQCKPTLIEPTGTLLELLTTTVMMSLLLIVLSQTSSSALVLEDVFEMNFQSSDMTLFPWLQWFLRGDASSRHNVSTFRIRNSEKRTTFRKNTHREKEVRDKTWNELDPPVRTSHSHVCWTFQSAERSNLQRGITK